MSPRRHRARYRQTVTLAIRFALQLWWLNQTSFLYRPQRLQAKRSRLYTRQASLFRDFAIAQGGLIVKLGQFLSVRIDVLPKEYIDQLSALQDALPPVDATVIIALIESELGRPLDQLFADFDRQPLAAASLGQVHQATLPDGRPVAVKVLRPGVDDLIDVDLRSVHTVLRLLDRFTSLGRWLDLAVFGQDFEDTFRAELDYQLEGRNAESFQRNFLTSPAVDIPQVHWSHSSRRVLTLEFMDGIKINDLEGLDAAGVDRPAVARRLLELYLQMFLDDGFYHADPHPGNVFVRPDGIVQLIDFGQVGAIPEAMRHDFLDLVRAVLTTDGGAAVAALERLGFLGPGADRRRLEAALEPVFASLSADLGFLFQGSGMIGLQLPERSQRSGSHPEPDWDQLRQFIWSQPITLPGNITFLGKTFITLVSDCYKLDPALDLAEAVGPRVRSLAGGDSWRELVSRLAADGMELARAAVPTAKRLVSVARRLEVGDLEVNLSGAQLATLLQAGQRQNQRLIRALTAAVATLAGLGLALFGPHPWIGLVLGAVGGLGLLLMSLPRRRRG
ncbi:MAG: hypothetical protein LBK42_02355 [Propionibacteriaceae bacterium]|jgi:predicted unusual protein kinase regulating ubiquinone biosynthesis (AarF/ABC1/UbiB family)|nr:hypothetical protein [Propionibacteriaceae bacterium]